MAECSFCGSVMRPATGKMYVKNNGQVLYFCKSKCQKNMLELGRDARKFKWTKFFVKGEAPAETKKVTEKVVKKAVKKVVSKAAKKE